MLHSGNNLETRGDRKTMMPWKKDMELKYKTILKVNLIKNKTVTMISLQDTGKH